MNTEGEKSPGCCCFVFVFFGGEDFGTGSQGAMAASAPSSSITSPATGGGGGGGGEADPTNSTNLRPPGSSRSITDKMLFHVCYLL